MSHREPGGLSVRQLLSLIQGLEAPIVVLADANHSKQARDDYGILCDWPANADAPRQNMIANGERKAEKRIGFVPVVHQL